MDLAHKKRILIIPGYKLYPMSSGSSIAQLGMLKELSTSLDVHLLLTPENMNKDDLANFKFNYPRVNIHYYKLKEEFETKWKRFDFGQIETLIKGWIRIFRKDSLNDLEEGMRFDLPRPKKGLVDFLNEILNKFRFDVIQVDLYPNLFLAPFLPQKVAKIYVCHECRYGRFETQIEAQNLQSMYYSGYVKYCKAIETAFFSFFDFILVFSPEDKKRVAAGTSVKVQVSPYAMSSYPTANTKKKVSKLVFLGSDGHYPNKDGVHWLIDELAPICVEKNIPVYIVGEWSKKSKNKLRRVSCVKFTGFIDDLDEFLSDAILLAPIRIGGGIKSKILYGLSRGIPVISTAFGVEGIPVTNRENILIADTPLAFVQAINQLLSSNELLTKIRRNAHELVRVKFNPENLAKVRLSVIHECLRSKHLLNLEKL